MKQIRERRPGRPIQPPAHPPEDILNPLVPRAAHAQTGFAVSLTPASAGTNCGPASLPSDTRECRQCLYHESPLAFAGTYMGQITHDSPNGSSIYVRELSVNWVFNSWAYTYELRVDAI